MEPAGIEAVHGRPLYLTRLGENWQWDGADIQSLTLFVAADASSVSDVTIREYASAALANGCGYVCTWGPDCERVHDLFDACYLDERVPDSSLAQFMSTSHDDESLPEALYFAMVMAHAESEAEWLDGPPPAVVLAVQEPWDAPVRALVADQDELARLWIANEP